MRSTRYQSPENKVNEPRNSLPVEEWGLLFYLANLRPPVSLDDLSELTGMPAVKTLALMEHLKGRKIVHEKREHGPGFYFLSKDAPALIDKNPLPESETREAMARIIRHYRRSLGKGNERTLILAELYARVEDRGEGLKYLAQAARLLSKAGRAGEAAPYLEHLLELEEEARPVDGSALPTPDSLFDMTWNVVHLLPPDRRTILLTKAAAAAERLGRTNDLARIKLLLGQLSNETGDYQTGARYLDESWRVAQLIGDQASLRMIALSASDSLFIEGRIADAIDRYERVVGGIEEFGEDETSLKAASTLGFCYVISGRVSRGLGMIEAARTRADSLGLAEIMLRCSLRKALSLLEVRKLSDAEECLEVILRHPQGKADPRLMSAAYTCLALVRTLTEDYREACLWRDRAIEHSRRIGRLPRGPHVLECLYRLEQKGYFHDTLRLSEFVDEILGQNDVYMKGIAYRYRALLRIRDRGTRGRAFLDLKNSVKYLEAAGAEMELARTRIVMGDAYLKEGEMTQGVSYLRQAWSLFSRIDETLFPDDLRVVVTSPEQKSKIMIDLIISTSESLGVIEEMSPYLERAVNVIMDFTMAMRGAFFLVDGGAPRITVSRNLDPMLLKQEQFKAIIDVVAAAALMKREIVMPGFGELEGLTEKALAEAGIRSLMCIPASLGGHIHGYLYLDNWFGTSSLPDEHLSYVRLLCKQIAIGFSHLSLLDEMKDLKERFQGEAFFYRREMGIDDATKEIVGESQAIIGVTELIRQVAPTDTSVLIVGETGVGKELVAKAIHKASPRKDGPFIPVNIAALPQELVASELFGHEKGAFTGANERHKGRFELAGGGTIFLDEIGDLPLNMQVKLLRVLQEGVFERLGATTPIRPDFRLVAATNKDLLREGERGAFRRDLYYRLNVFPISVPPLRERKDDIPLLAAHFVDRFVARTGRPVGRPAPEDLKRLEDYEWPGNVRELQHFIERSIILSNGPEIRLSAPTGPFFADPSMAAEEEMASLSDVEKRHIERVLSATRWRVSGPKGAAAILKIKPTTLLYRMQKLGIVKPATKKMVSR
jgi:transcriptional regulator with GAF, ATPase, and Fis domain